ncbi:MAG: TetR family transcriptional regulator [Acidimicrobiia bacterium]|nr:TetR family transcriptional regulator [Acidimicrobiia bacterium]
MTMLGGSAKEGIDMNDEVSGPKVAAPTDWPSTLGMESEDRRERKRAQKMNTILRTAASLIAERGYHGMNLEDIADRLDLAKASLYHYYSSKENLALTCLETCANFVSSELRRIADTDAPAIDRLRTMIQRQLELTVRDTPELAHLFLHPLDWPDSIRPRMKVWREEHNELFSQVIAEAIEAGELNPKVEYISRAYLFGSLNHVPIWLRSSPELLDDVLPVLVDLSLGLFEPRVGDDDV